MPFSHHSHSGQFCGHATNTLQEVVEKAISMGMTTFCLTEHIPRQRVDFYPGEENSHTVESLERLFDDYYRTARQLQKDYADRIQLLVGFEGEWIREYSRGLMEGLLEKYPVDLFVGSVHHVHTFPIDYDGQTYIQAREAAGGSDERLFEDYFDDQYAMLQAMKPPVVGHFDLIRLKSDDPNRSLRAWSGVWDRVMRNLNFIAEYGGVIELNSSGVRKGMREAYPQVEICQEFQAMGGRFTFSDDSHGCDQVGAKYNEVRQGMNDAGITEISCLTPATAAGGLSDSRFAHVAWRAIPTPELDQHAFWETSKTS